MRIVSGKYGGRKLSVPKGNDIRPTSDKIRGAVFNILRSRGTLEGTVVIDAFCGTGALGLEALSQGASSCSFIDKNKDSLNLAKQNVEAFGVEDEARFILKDSTKLGPRPADMPLVTLAFLDPPYNQTLVTPTLAALHEGGWLAGEALLVLEVEKSFNESLPTPFKVLDERNYGGTTILLAGYEAIDEAEQENA
ncbi:MAG: methyltransferase [Micavibrio sp.]|nr:MAG: methyltransferase [Micavibrio sp.]